MLCVYLHTPLCIVDVHCGKNDNKVIYLEQTTTMHDLKPTLSNDINSNIDTQTPIYFRHDYASTNELQISNVFFNKLAPMTTIFVYKIDII